jgi:predicted nuclease of restriction endonuclease-like RecB superfamily
VLTKDLVQCRIDHDRVRPKFVDTTSAELLALAEELLSLFQMDPPPTRAEIDENASALIRGQRDVWLAKGLYKLVLDRAEFSQPGDDDYAACRQEIFAASARQLLADPPEDPDAYRAAVLAEVQLPPTVAERGIYGDLPQFEHLLSPPAINARQLLERYNVGLVQALLLTADGLTVKVKSPEPAQLRRLFKYLKFFRLLVRINACQATRKGEVKAMEFEVAGPASVLGQTRRYGLQLASFFPAVCSLDSWRIETAVEWRNERRELRLDQRSGLVCHYRNFGAYVPDEIKLFHRDFKAKETGWEIFAAEKPLKLAGGEYVFPDLSFRNADGKELHLELFHRWHAGPFLKRLRQLADEPDQPLIIGVDRAVANKGEAKQALAACNWFEDRGFLFRDYPTVDRTRRCLDKLLAARDADG